MNQEFDIYVFLGKVETEDEKVLYWDQFKELYTIINPLMTELSYKKVMSEQSFKKLLKKNKDGTYNVTYKNAPTGGKLNWNLKNCEKICTKYLTENDHLKYVFQNGRAKLNEKFLISRGQLLEFENHEIYGARTKKPEILDFILRVFSKEDNDGEYNQHINLYISKDLRVQEPQKIDTIIRGIALLNKTKIIYTGSRQWLYKTFDSSYGIDRIDYLINKRYSASKNLKMRESQYINWQEYKLA